MNNNLTLAQADKMLTAKLKHFQKILTKAERNPECSKANADLRKGTVQDLQSYRNKFRNVGELLDDVIDLLQF